MHRLSTEGARPITEVLFDIGRNAQDLLRSEIQLAQSGVRDRLLGARSAAVLLAVGAAAALLGMLFLLIALLFALRLFMPGWAAAGCIAVLLAITATLALQSGVRRFKASPPLFSSHGHSDQRNEERLHGSDHERPDRKPHPQHA